MRAAEVAFVGALVHSRPWLMPVLQGHLDANECLLPHLLLADIERWAEARLSSYGGDDSQLKGVFEFLEQGYAVGDPHVEELISVSFLELLPGPNEPLAELRELVGSRLRQQLDVIG